MALREEVKTKYEEAKAADENLAKQEERYRKIAQDSAETAVEEEAVAEEETTPEETAAICSAPSGTRRRSVPGMIALIVLACPAQMPYCPSGAGIVSDSHGPS